MGCTWWTRQEKKKRLKRQGLHYSRLPRVPLLYSLHWNGFPKKQNLILIWFFFISPYFLILNKSNFNKAILAIFLRACLFHFAYFLLLLLLLFSFRFLLYFIYFTFYYYYYYYYYYFLYYYYYFILVVFKIIHQNPAFKEFSKFHFCQIIYLFIYFQFSSLGIFLESLKISFPIKFDANFFWHAIFIIFMFFFFFMF